MEIHNLVVETTRRCNMRCSHCLRGNPENKAMKIEYLRSFLHQISYVSSVTFTGGEPTLPSGLRVISDFMDVCNEFRVCVGSYYMVTNAKVWRPEIATTVAVLHNFCDDNEISGVDISTDRYHDPIQHRRMAFKDQLEYDLEYKYGVYGEHLVRTREDIRWENIIDEGRGMQYGSGRTMELEDIYLEYWDDDGEARVTEGDIYINCEGKVIRGCDWSYESQREPDKIICSVDDDFEESVKAIAIQQETA